MNKILFNFQAALLIAALPLIARELPVASPEEAGMSSAKLARVDETVDKLVNEKKLAGATVMITRHGRVVYFKAFGQMDVASDKPMRQDTLFRIYSMSKSITSAAVLMLCEEGKIGLDDPVSKHLPEFKGLKRWAPEEPVPIEREPTVRDLLRHTAGFTYGLFGNSAVDQLYRRERVLSDEHDLETMTKKLAGLPLVNEPGKAWIYSVATDVLGRLVEVISGMPFDEFLQKRIFEPLDMADTGFFVPTGKVGCFATTYASDGKGTLTVSDAPSNSRYLKKRPFLSGGGGLVSTTRDYMRFLCMIGNGGELHGTRLLKNETVEQMIQNQLPPEAMPIQVSGLKRPGVGSCNKRWPPRVGRRGEGVEKCRQRAHGDEET